MNKEKIQEIAFNLINLVGQARSNTFNAMQNLGDKKITREEFDIELKEATKLLNEAGKEHLSIIQNEAQGVDIEHSILLMHAEDLYLTTSTMIEMMLKMINLFELKK